MPGCRPAQDADVEQARQTFLAMMPDTEKIAGCAFGELDPDSREGALAETGEGTVAAYLGYPLQGLGEMGGASGMMESRVMVSTLRSDISFPESEFGYTIHQFLAAALQHPFVAADQEEREALIVEALVRVCRVNIASVD